MRRSIVLLFLVLAAPIAVAATGPKRLRVIEYQAGPCFGTCPAYRLIIGSNGVGRFEGMRNTAAKGSHDFAVSAAQWADFEHRLEPLHGSGVLDLTDARSCRRMATDMASIDVRWAGDQRPFLLHAYLGCDPDRNRKLFDRLRSAPDALPVAELIGPH